MGFSLDGGKSMSRIGFVRLSLVVVLTLTAHQLWASTSVTYVVGTCRPKLPTFSTISAALAATPPPDTVMVCPGTYPEQVTITQPVILQGVSDGDSGQVVIGLQAGLFQTETADDGIPISQQVLVKNATGSVTISDITIDDTNAYAGQFGYLVGVCLESSSSAIPSITLNHIITRNQSDFLDDIYGVGVFVNGGATDASVTVENSSIHDFTVTGIETQAGSGALVVTIKGNYVNPGPPVAGRGQSVQTGIFIASASTATVTNNFVVGALQSGITAFSSGGSISGNTLIGNQYGITTYADGIPVTGNKILNSSVAAIALNTSAATITGNTITNAPTGIDFQCFADINVNTNTIIDATTGLLDVPSSATTSNSYFNVATIRSGGC
jgi:hypothetical protein